MAKKKQTKKPDIASQKKTQKPPIPSVSQKVIWIFDNIDADGAFAFNPSRSDFEAQVVLGKIISYSGMTWREIAEHTHDESKSKHHFLDYEGLSDAAKKRLEAKKIGNDKWEQIFSFALTNKLRIIGLREDEKFHVLWYDPNHEVYPVKQR